MNGFNSTTQLYKMSSSNVSNFLKDCGHLTNAKIKNTSHLNTTFTSMTTPSTQKNMTFTQVMLLVSLDTEEKS